MTNDNRDPVLQAVFATASQELMPDEFSARIILQTDKLKRRAVVARFGAGLAFALLAVMLQDAVFPLTDALLLPLIELEGGLLAQSLAPVNSVAGLLSLVLLGLRAIYKKIFS